MCQMQSKGWKTEFLSYIAQLTLTWLYTWKVVGEGTGLGWIHLSWGTAYHVTRGAGRTLLFLPLGRLAHSPGSHLQLQNKHGLVKSSQMLQFTAQRTTQEGKNENKISWYLKLSLKKKCQHTNRCINTHIQTCHFCRKTFWSVRMLRWLCLSVYKPSKTKVGNFHPIYLILKCYCLYRDGKQKKRNYSCSSSLTTALTFILLFLKQHLVHPHTQNSKTTEWWGSRKRFFFFDHF